MGRQGSTSTWALVPAWAALLGLLLSVSLPGCGSSDASADAATTGSTGGNYNGGQTGSLIPSCGIGPVTRDGAAVPSGEQAFIFYTRGCATPPNFDQLMVTDAAGETVPVQWEEIDTDVYLIKGSVVLTEGEYDVTLPAGVEMPTATVNVSEVEPLPTSAGELRRYDEYCDIGKFQLEPSAELVPYLPLTRFTYRLDGIGIPQLAVDFGALKAMPGPVEIPVMSGCIDTCSLTERHQLTLYATIAGETAQPDPASIEFSIRCGDDMVDNTSGCAVSSAGGGKPVGQPAWPLLVGGAGLLAAIMGRRRGLARHGGIR
jgi:hypothetical protein